MRIDGRVQRVLAATRFGDIEWLDEVDSTNRYLLDQARAGAPERVVVADHQHAGRGRLGRRWEAPAGSALLVSVLLRPEGLAAQRLHLLSAAVGLAGREACARVAGVAADLKWPNDLLVGDAKLAGVLAESWPGAVVVGMGLNVTAAPAGAASLAGVAGRAPDRGDLLAAFLVALDRWYGDWDGVAAQYRRACATVGRWVRVEEPDGVVVGRAVGVDDAGRLLVAGDEGVRALAVGDVVHLRTLGGDDPQGEGPGAPPAAPGAPG